MKIKSNKIAAASVLVAVLASGIGAADAQVISPRGATGDGPMSITVPFVVAAAKVPPAKQPYTLIVEAPVARTPDPALTPPIFPER